MQRRHSYGRSPVNNLESLALWPDKLLFSLWAQPLFVRELIAQALELDVQAQVCTRQPTQGKISLIGYSFRVLFLYDPSCRVREVQRPVIKGLGRLEKARQSNQYTIYLFFSFTFCFLLRSVRCLAPCPSSPRAWLIFAVLRCKAVGSPPRKRGIFVALLGKHPFVVAKVRRLS